MSGSGSESATTGHNSSVSSSFAEDRWTMTRLCMVFEYGDHQCGRAFLDDGSAHGVIVSWHDKRENKSPRRTR